MSTLKIIHYPHKDLRKTATQITTFDDSLHLLIKQLFDTMYAVHGWGLAAPQVGSLLRLFVMDISPQQNQPLCLINPEILEKEGEVQSEEDSLSFPGVYIKIPRASQIKVKYQDEGGTQQITKVHGLAATGIQQGVDLLNGILFIDHLSNLKRTRLLKKFDKLKEEGKLCGSPSCHHHH